MKDRIGFALLFLLGVVLGLVFWTDEARAQQPAPAIKPGTESLGRRRGRALHGNFEHRDRRARHRH